MTLQDAAKTYGYADATLRQAVKRGVLPAKKVGPVWTVRTVDMQAYMGGKSESGRGRPRKPGRPRRHAPTPDHEPEEPTP